VNRKERRFAASRTAEARSPGTLSALLAAAAEHLRAGRLAEAAQLYERVLAIRPDLAETRVALANTIYTLGNAVRRAGNLAMAAEYYARAVALRPPFAAAHGNLIRALLASGRVADGLAAAIRGVHQAGTIETKRLLVRCARDAPLTAEPPGLRDLLTSAFDEGWSRSTDLAHAAARLLRLDPLVARVASSVARSATGGVWPEGAVSGLGRNALLLTHLVLAAVTDPALEGMLTSLRARLLRTVDAGDHLDLRTAMARQCCINEYIFAPGPGEAADAEALRDSIAAALAASTPVAPARLATAAMYAPLHELAGMERLLERAWPDSVAALVAQQVGEPIEERRLRAGIEPLTAVDDPVSLAVRAQYEENPYPRWVRADLIEATTLDALLRRAFPLASYESQDMTAPDVLVAGCGTGQHSITTARRFPAARILAVDLSLASLAYAARKTAELGITTVEYAQADILALASLPRKFDLIEASGVLHHLAVPLEGWRVLVGLLKPGGIMRLGFYSARGRRHVAAARAVIAERGLLPTPDGIHAARRALLARAPDDPAGWVAQSADFYTMSGCRDLVFHVQEQCLSLPEIGAFMERMGLRLLGFDLDEGIRQRYRASFPQDALGTDLRLWDRFEAAHPTCFTAMYQFWVQSP
jgi:SAM-dependent methyltransferase